MNQLYLIESGVMLDAVKNHIEQVKACRIAYSDFAQEYGAKQYYHNSKKLYGLSLRKAPDGWTKPKKNGETYPKRGHADCDKIKNLPELPDQCDAIFNITGVPLCISYEGDGTSGSTCIGSPLNECGFLYIQRHNLYAFWTPDVKKYLEDYSQYKITNGADKWEMKIDGVTPISQAKWDLLVAECKVKDEEE